ncbi:MAG: hypothetical protein WCB46_01980 [Methanoregula sp.]
MRERSALSASMFTGPTGTRTVIIRAFTFVIAHGAVITGMGFAGINLAGGFHPGSSPA